MVPPSPIPNVRMTPGLFLMQEGIKTPAGISMTTEFFSPCIPSTGNSVFLIAGTQKYVRKG